MRRIVIRLSHEIKRALESPPKPAAAGLRGGIGQVVIKDAGDDLAVTVEIQPIPAAPARCLIRVEADIPSRGGWPNLSGTRVTLKRDEHELETRETDPFGEVVFGEIAIDDLPNLTIVVQPVLA